MSGWIKCSDRMPEFGRHIVFWEGQAREMFFNEEDDMGPARWFFFNGCGEMELDTDEIKHWQPFPSPPQD